MNDESERKATYTETRYYEKKKKVKERTQNVERRQRERPELKNESDYRENTRLKKKKTDLRLALISRDLGFRR